MKRKVTTILAALLSIAMLCACFAGCSAPATAETATSEQPAATEAPAEATAAAEKTNYTVAMVLTDLTNDFYVNMKTAGQDCADDYGFNIIFESCEGSMDTQTTVMQNMIAQGVNCILVDPIDAQAIIPSIKEAEAAGIPVVTMGNKVDYTWNINTLYNDYQDSYVIGQILAKLSDESGEVGLIYGCTGNFCSDQRQAGFEAAIKEYPNMTVYSVPGNWSSEDGYNAAADLMNSHPDLKAIHSVSDSVTYSVLKAIQDAGKQDSIILSSYDGETTASENVKNGDFLLTLLTGSMRVGYYNAYVGYCLAAGYDIQGLGDDHILYLSSHFIMNDDLKAKVEGWGIAYDGMDILSPDDGVAMFSGYRTEWAPDVTGTPVVAK